VRGTADRKGNRRGRAVQTVTIQKTTIETLGLGFPYVGEKSPKVTGRMPRVSLAI
jgi:hypothetical protein